MRGVTGAAALIGVLVAGPAPAQDEPSEKAREGAQQLIEALEGWLNMLPRYGTPRITEDGDILIPRLDSPDNGGEDMAPDPPDPPDSPSTGTRT